MSTCNCIEYETMMTKLAKEISKLKSNDPKVTNLKKDFKTYFKLFELANCDKGCKSSDCVNCYLGPTWIKKYTNIDMLTAAQKKEFATLLINLGKSCDSCSCSDCHKILSMNVDYINKVMLDNIKDLLPNVPKKQ